MISVDKVVHSELEVTLSGHVLSTDRGKLRLDMSARSAQLRRFDVSEVTMELDVWRCPRRMEVCMAVIIEGKWHGYECSFGIATTDAVLKERSQRSLVRLCTYKMNHIANDMVAQIVTAAVDEALHAVRTEVDDLLRLTATAWELADSN